jgi:hypothetical protein
MDGLINAIRNARETEKKVEYYFTMSIDEKHELLHDLAKEKSEDIGVFLNAVYPDEPDKNTRKMIRKMIFRLKSSGVKVDEPGHEGASALHKVEDVRDNRAYLTNFDLAQSRMVMAAYEVKKNMFVFLNGEIHFREGLRELMSTPLDRKNLDDLIRAYRDNTVEPAFMGEVSPAYAAYIVEEGSRMSGRFSDAAASLKAFVAHIKDPVSRPEQIYSLPVEKDTPQPALQDIVSHPIFAPFTLTWENIDRDRSEYNSQGTAGIVLPQHMIEEKKGAFIDTLITTDAVSSQAPRLKRMLEDYAYLLYRTADRGRYRGIVSALGTDESLRQMIIHFVRKTLEEGEDKKTADPGLIVNPYG